MARYNFYNRTQNSGRQNTGQTQAPVSQNNAARSLSGYPGYLISIGSLGEYVRQIQRCLNNLSSRYPQIGRINEDGAFGPATRNAVVAFQQAFGLSADGIVGNSTWGRLLQECGGQSSGNGYPGYALGTGSSGGAVMQIQKALNKIYGNTAGYSKLAEDGKFGSATRATVMQFQRQNGLYADGIVGPATWAKIMSVSGGSPGNGGGSPGNGGGSPGNGGGSPGNGGGSPGGSGLSSDEQEVFNLINKQRTQNGLPALQIDTKVQKVARLKAQDMSENNYFSHTSPTYGSPFQMLQQFGVSYSTAAENIAANGSNSGAVTSWMNSSGHRANILSNAYNLTGIGIAPDPVYGKKYVQMFIGR